MSIESGIQQILDALGVQLDNDSFANVMALLPMNRVSAWQKVVIAAALGVFAGLIRKWLNERRLKAEIAAQAVQA
jgi:uncharacterized membrane protein YjjP (DUF1212 family)